MTALSDALDHSQAKALTALFKAYTRRDDEPDDELFAGLMRGVGLDDDVQIGFLLNAWSILREDREALPGTIGPAGATGGEPGKVAPEQVVEKRTWTSGKHKGVTLADTPADYLEWAQNNHPDPIGRQAAKDELGRRDEGVPF